MESKVKLYSFNYSQARTYVAASIFIIGNIALPQLCHTVHLGGKVMLPIYFFTLIGAYKYGWKVGLLTALLSPTLNHMLFGMPALAVLPAILTKSVLLAVAAALAGAYFKKVSIAIVAAVVAVYQIVGTMVEWAICGDLMLALSDFRIGIPGIVFQIIGGYLFIRYVIKK